VYGANSPIWDVEFAQNAVHGSTSNGAGKCHDCFSVFVFVGPHWLPVMYRVQYNLCVDAVCLHCTCVTSFTHLPVLVNV